MEPSIDLGRKVPRIDPSARTVLSISSIGLPRPSRGSSCKLSKSSDGAMVPVMRQGGRPHRAISSTSLLDERTRVGRMRSLSGGGRWRRACGRGSHGVAGVQEETVRNTEYGTLRERKPAAAPDFPNRRGRVSNLCFWRLFYSRFPQFASVSCQSTPSSTSSPSSHPSILPSFLPIPPPPCPARTPAQLPCHSPYLRYLINSTNPPRTHPGPGFFTLSMA